MVADPGESLLDRCRELIESDPAYPEQARHRPFYHVGDLTAIAESRWPGAAVVYAQWGHVELTRGGRLWVVDGRSSHAGMVVLLAHLGAGGEYQALATLVLTGGHAALVVDGLDLEADAAEIREIIGSAPGGGA